MPGRETGKQSGRAHRVLLFISLAVCGLAIFVIGSPYYSVLPTNKNPQYTLGLVFLFLVFTLWLLRSARFKKYWQIMFAFFTAAFANWVLTSGLFSFLITSPSIVQRITEDKLAQFLSVVPAILVLSMISPGDMRSLYIKKGRLGLSLALGLVIGLAMVFPFISMGGWKAAQNAGAMRIISWLPWLLVFASANAVMEELWFRAIFLRKLETLLGAKTSNLLTSIVYAVAHLGAWGLPLVAVTFFLGVGCAYIMRKTDSLSGAVMGHAIADILFMLASAVSLTIGT